MNIPVYVTGPSSVSDCVLRVFLWVVGEGSRHGDGRKGEVVFVVAFRG